MTTPYVIVKEGPRFATPPGSVRSYTPLITDAMLFSSYDSADKHGKCENERIRPISDFFHFWPR